jgi:hypothetical protein
MITSIKVVGEDYVYEGSIDVSKEYLELDVKNLYQVLTQMGPNGQVGYGFLRGDNGIIPYKDIYKLKVSSIVGYGEVDESSMFAKVFSEQKVKESARKAQILM